MYNKNGKIVCCAKQQRDTDNPDDKLQQINLIGLDDRDALSNLKDKYQHWVFINKPFRSG